MEYEYIYPIKYKIYIYYVPDEEEYYENNSKEELIMLGYDKYLKIKEIYGYENFEIEYLNVYQNIEWLYEKIWNSQTNDLIILINCFYDLIYEDKYNLRRYIIENKYSISQNFDIILNKELKDTNEIEKWKENKKNLPKLAIIKKDCFFKLLNQSYNNINIYYSTINVYENKIDYNINQYIIEPIKWIIDLI